ncbi:MAG: SHOCT domain-containing protein [Anaerolinea sp.]|nr:SHOCT domain-containing protein [Anaerolinea sp.]
MRSSRNNRPSLIGTAARTAVVVGTATAVSGAVAGSQQQKAAAQQAQATAAQQQALAQQQAALEAAQAAAAPATGLTDDTLAQLKQMGELHQAGILSDEEFAAMKARLLGL